MLKCNGFDLQTMSWESFRMQVGLDVKRETTMGTMDYHRCIAYEKGWVSKPTAERREDWAGKQLEERLYWRIRFLFDSVTSVTVGSIHVTRPVRDSINPSGRFTPFFFNCCS